MSVNDVEIIDTEITHPFKLTREEIADFGIKVSSMTTDLADLEDKFTYEKKHWKGKIDNKKRDIRTVMCFIRDGEEPRKVAVKAEYNYKNNEVKYYYEGELLTARAMTTHEIHEHIEKVKREKPQAIPGVK
jgi:hypothetical protein